MSYSIFPPRTPERLMLSPSSYLPRPLFEVNKGLEQDYQYQINRLKRDNINVQKNYEQAVTQNKFFLDQIKNVQYRNNGDYDRMIHDNMTLQFNVKDLSSRLQELRRVREQDVAEINRLRFFNQEMKEHYEDKL